MAATRQALICDLAELGAWLEDDRMRDELEGLPQGADLVSLLDRLAAGIGALPASGQAGPGAYADTLRELAEAAPGEAFRAALLGTLGNPTGATPCAGAKDAAERARVLRQLAGELVPGEARKAEIWRTVRYGLGEQPTEVRAVRLWNGTVQVFHRYTGALIAQSLPGLPWVLAPWLH